LVISAAPPPPLAALALDVCPDPVEWARRAFGFQPDPVQCEILHCPNQELMLCCTRQYGKSRITAIKALHFALRNPGAFILVAGPTARQSGEWILKTDLMLRHLGIEARGERIGYGLNLPNGSRLVGLPGHADNVRAYSAVSLLIFDEAAFIKDKVYEALLPMLAVSRGSLWQMSTPNGQIGYFYEDWHRVDPAVAHFRVTAPECPRIPPEFLARQKLRLGEVAFKRDYLCEFAPNAIQIFTRDLIDRCLDYEFEPWNNGQALWPEDQ
jgi:hypothetical protein